VSSLGARDSPPVLDGPSDAVSPFPALKGRGAVPQVLQRPSAALTSGDVDLSARSGVTVAEPLGRWPLALYADDRPYWGQAAPSTSEHAVG
jgi:hypothetical protein